MGSNSRKRKTRSGITRKRTNRTRMTNKKRTSKRLYKRSLRKNKYRSHKKRRTLMKGGRPEGIGIRASIAERGEQANQRRAEREKQRRTLSKGSNKLTNKKKRRRSNSGRGKLMKQYYRRKKDEGSLTKTALRATAATAAGIGAVVAAPSLGILGVGAGATAGVGALGYMAKRGIESFGQDYSFERLPAVVGRDKDLIFKLDYKKDKDKNNSFYLITDKNSECIDLLINHMNAAYDSTEKENPETRGGGPSATGTGSPPAASLPETGELLDDDDGDDLFQEAERQSHDQGTRQTIEREDEGQSEESRQPPHVDEGTITDETEPDETEQDENGFPLKTIESKYSPVDYDILKGELDIETAKDYGQSGKEAELRKTLHQKYNEKIDIIIQAFDAALNDPGIEVDHLCDNFKVAIIQETKIILNQWILGYDPDTNPNYTRVTLTEKNTNGRKYYDIPKIKNEKDKYIKQLKGKAKKMGIALKGTNIKELCQKVVYKMNIDRDARRLIDILVPPTSHDVEGDTEFHVAPGFSLESELPVAGPSVVEPVASTERERFGLESEPSVAEGAGFTTVGPPVADESPSVAQTVEPIVPAPAALQELSGSPEVQKIYISDYTIANKKSGKLSNAHPYFFGVTLHQGNEQKILPTFRLSELKKWVDNLDSPEGPDQAAEGLTYALNNVGKKPSDKSYAFELFIDAINVHRYNIEWFDGFVEKMKTKYSALNLLPNEGEKFDGTLPPPNASVLAAYQEAHGSEFNAQDTLSLKVWIFPFGGKLVTRDLEDVRSLVDLKNKVKVQAGINKNIAQWDIYINTDAPHVAKQTVNQLDILNDIDQLKRAVGNLPENPGRRDLVRLYLKDKPSAQGLPPE